MRIFEHKIVDDSDAAAETKEDAEGYLNALGAEGWRLVAIDPNGVWFLVREVV